MEASQAAEIIPTVRDIFTRPLKVLRLSVTDRCNLRCQYCMPEENYTWLPRPTLLRFEEMATLTDMLTQVGIDKVRVTGGEPLLRQNLPTLINSFIGILGLRKLP